MHPEIKLQCFWKVCIWRFRCRWLVHEINTCMRFLDWNKNFKKLKYLQAKLCSLWQFHLVLPILFALHLESGFWIAPNWPLIEKMTIVTQFANKVPSIFFYIVVFLLPSLVTGPSFMSVSLMVLEFWLFSFINY